MGVMDSEFVENIPPGSNEGDAHLWRALSSKTDTQAFLQAWLAILSRSVGGLHFCGVVTFENEKPKPVAIWPPDASADLREKFSEIAEAVTPVVAASRQPAVLPAPGGGESLASVPIIVEGDIFAVIVAGASVSGMAGAQRLIRHLQWGGAWLEVLGRRQAGTSDRSFAERAERLITVMQSVVGEPNATAAAQALMGGVVDAIGFSWAAFGVVKGETIVVEQMTQATRIDRNEKVPRLIAAAMLEAADQRNATCVPSVMDEEVSGLAYDAAELSRSCDGAPVIVVPIQREDAAVGVVVLVGQPNAPLTAEQFYFAEAAVAAAGLAYYDKRLAELGLPQIALRRAGRVLSGFVSTKGLTWKAAVIAATAFLGWAILTTSTMRVTARVQIQGEVRRLLGAPFDGFIKAQYASAGQLVKAGGLLAELDEGELELELLRHLSRRRQTQLERDRALGSRDLAAANIAGAQLAQIDAEVELARQKLARTKVTAPFDAVVVSGDLSQAIGRPVTRGETMFEIAPLDRYKVTAIVAESDIRYVKEGSEGEVLLQALPDQAIPVSIHTITSVARVSDGVNGFEVVGAFKDNETRVRPGMEGLVHIDAGQERRIVIWTRSLVDWIRLHLWSLRL